MKTYEELEAIALGRHNLHTKHKSSRPLSSDYELIGLLGEEAFARSFGFGEEHLRLTAKGDGRVDFYTDAGTVDVKTAEKAYNLLMERGVPHAEILVLAKFNRAKRSISLLGWEYSLDMVDQPYKDFGYGIINYYKPANELRSMASLRDMLGR